MTYSTDPPAQELSVVRATRFIEPLREGGSLPALMEADDLGTYVVKFTGAGQGTTPLTAEIVVTGLAHRLGIRSPRLVFVDLDEEFGRREPDPEIQHLLTSSAGVNLGVDFLPRALGFTDGSGVPSADAAAILWLDALTVNVDRTWRNPNLLIWHGDLWAIDHGASLIFQHTWPDTDTFAKRAYPIDEHVLSAFADDLADADARLRPLVTREALDDIVAAVPETWLPTTSEPSATRKLYVDYLAARAEAADTWLSRGGAQ